jgi:TolA-binding protein
MALSWLLWPACSTEQNRASQDENRGAEAAKQERQMYQDKIEAKLRDLDQQIETLKTKMGKLDKADRRQFEKQMAELDRKRAAAHEEFEKLKNPSQEAWQDLKAGIDAAINDLEAAYRQAASHFK